MKRNGTAIIDIGSNSVRLMLAQNEGLNKKLINSTLLAEGLQSSGKLSAAAIYRTVKAVYDYTLLATNAGYSNIYIFATEAVRSSSNGSEFTSAIKRTCGIDVDVISGQDEACLGFYGASLVMPSPIVVIDIGGASVELVYGDKTIEYAKSLPIGVVRLQEKYGNNVKLLENFLKSELVKYKKIPKANPVAVGGTATSLSAMNMNLTAYDENIVHGSVLTHKDLDNLTERIFNSSDLTSEFPTLSPNRAKVIGQGAILLRLLMKYIDQEKITISEYDNMEGYIVYKNI